jgi:hypothetical protein
MLEPTKPSAPQPPVPPPWGKIAFWLIVIGLIVAFAVVPSFRHKVTHAWDVTIRFFGKLMGF